MNLLSIGGSDPSSGAGIQSDIKTFYSLNVHGLTIITAITGQNTSTFGMVEPVSQEILKNQLGTILGDFKIDGIKIGMVFNSQTIRILYRELKKIKIPIVVDPVIKSTTGGLLIKKSAIKDFRKYMIPLATVITPNKFEAEILSKTKFNSENSFKKIGKILQEMGAKNVVITGIKGKNNQILDFVFEAVRNYSISGDYIARNNHGSGCNYSAAMLFALAKNKSIHESVTFAKEFTYKSIKNAKKIGNGIPVTNIQETDRIHLELLKAIDEFVDIKNIYKNIPECQTNFVYSKENPKSINDISGISGRIVKTGKEVTVAGDIRYGGSKHVATALLTISSKYPQIRSAINLKYQNSTISKAKKSKLLISRYNRILEPKNVKSGGSSIQWGIEQAIKSLKNAPDIIFHKGDLGKEPMILIFGKNPNDAIEKILKII